MSRPTEHSSLPWHATESFLAPQVMIRSGNLNVAAVNSTSKGESMPRDANAALICRAVNCHADLLAACGRALNLVLMLGDPLGEHQQAVQDIRAAIARAEGE